MTEKLSERAIDQLYYVENSDIFDKDVSLEPSDFIIIEKSKVEALESENTYLKNSTKHMKCMHTETENCPCNICCSHIRMEQTLRDENQKLREQVDSAIKIMDFRQSLLEGFRTDAFANLVRAEKAEAEVKTLQEKYEPRCKCVTCGKLESICEDHALWVEDCPSYVNVIDWLKSNSKRDWDNSMRLVKENVALKSRLAKARNLLEIWFRQIPVAFIISMKEALGGS